MSVENDKLSLQRELNRAFGDEMTRGIELAVTPLVFGAIGWLLDTQFGTGPWLAVAFGVFATIGTVVKLWFGYDATMRDMETRGRWNRATAAAADQVDAAVDLWTVRRDDTGRGGAQA